MTFARGGGLRSRRQQNENVQLDHASAGSAAPSVSDSDRVHDSVRRVRRRLVVVGTRERSDLPSPAAVHEPVTQVIAVAVVVINVSLAVVLIAEWGAGRRAAHRRRSRATVEEHRRRNNRAPSCARAPPRKRDGKPGPRSSHVSSARWWQTIREAFVSYGEIAYTCRDRRHERSSLRATTHRRAAAGRRRSEPVQGAQRRAHKRVARCAWRARPAPRRARRRLPRDAHSPRVIDGRSTALSEPDEVGRRRCSTDS